MSIAGKIRASARDRSRTTSLLPVPLNSSKISWSIREPVLIRQVAMIVTEPPFSIVRARPNSRRGISIIPASSPPLIVCRRGAPGRRLLLLNALPNRVRLSINSTIWRPHSSSVCTWASISSANSVCSSALWSLVLAKISAPSVARRN